MRSALRFATLVFTPFRRTPDATDWWQIVLALLVSLFPGASGAILRFRGETGEQGFWFTISFSLAVLALLFLLAAIRLWREREKELDTFRFSLDPYGIVSDPLGSSYHHDDGDEEHGTLRMSIGFGLAVRGSQDVLDYRLKSARVATNDGTVVPLPTLNNDGGVVHKGAPVEFKFWVNIPVSGWPVTFLTEMEFIFRDPTRRNRCAGVKKMARVTVERMKAPVGNSYLLQVGHFWEGRAVNFNAPNEPDWVTP